MSWGKGMGFNKKRFNKNENLSKNKTLKRNEKYYYARYIRKKIPKNIGKRWTEYLKKTVCSSFINSKERMEFIMEFQVKQIHRLLIGIVLSVVIILCCIGYSFYDHPLIFERNPFGKGEKEILLTVEKGKKSEDISLILEEKSLSEKEEQEIFQVFYKELLRIIPGKNSSLLQVNKPLNFVDRVEGYPFEIIYEPEDPGLIDWNGNLGKAGMELSEGERMNSHILIKASYGEYYKEKNILVCLIPQEKKTLTFVQKLQKSLEQQEKNSREQKIFQVDTLQQDTVIKDKSSGENIFWKLPLFVIILAILLCVRDYSLSKEKKKDQHKENMEDFPLIVHLMTLYMSAGLSFPSVVEKICGDYERNPYIKGERYAFEQIRSMNHLIHMGIRPKEACMDWGKNFSEKEYGKLAMIVSQSLSKGAKEIRSMMEQEQRDAFQIQVDYVRRCAEEASTKLLFPMICLLFIIMVLVIFPALMQFQGF